MLKSVWQRCTIKKEDVTFYKENESILYSNNFVDERNRRSASCINHGNFTVPIYAGIRAVNPPIGAFDRETNNPHGIAREAPCFARLHRLHLRRVFQRGEKSREFCKFENFTLRRAISYRTRTCSRCFSPDSLVDAGQAAFSSPADQAATFYRSPKSLEARRQDLTRPQVMQVQLAATEVDDSSRSSPPSRVSVSVLPFFLRRQRLPRACHTVRGLTGFRKNDLVLWKDKIKPQMLEMQANMSLTRLDLEFLS